MQVTTSTSNVEKSVRIGGWNFWIAVLPLDKVLNDVQIFLLELNFCRCINIIDDVMKIIYEESIYPPVLE